MNDDPNVATIARCEEWIVKEAVMLALTRADAGQLGDRGLARLFEEMTASPKSMMASSGHCKALNHHAESIGLRLTAVWTLGEVLEHASCLAGAADILRDDMRDPEYNPLDEIDGVARRCYSAAEWVSCACRELDVPMPAWVMSTDDGPAAPYAYRYSDELKRWERVT